MKRHSLLTIAVAAVVATLTADTVHAQTGGPDTFGYQYAPATYGFVTLDPANGGQGTAQVISSGSELVSVPFPFLYYGNSYSEVLVDDEPGVIMGAGTAFINGVNTALPTTSSAHPDLAVFWDEINASGGTIWSWYDVANERLILSWEGHGVIGGTESGAWQVHLGADHSVEYHYEDTTFGSGVSQNNGGTATIGIQDRRGGTSAAGGYLQWSFDQQLILDGQTAIRFSLCADADLDGWADTACGGQDCLDNAASSFPGAPELCDGVDNDCDPTTSETGDNDADGLSACGGDCNDAEPTIYTGAPELCDGLDNDCDGVVPGDETSDADGDGSVTCADCDDTDVAVLPGAPELCDGLDNDCDSSLSDEEVDADLDGALFCEDCDDTDANRGPTVSEVCDGVDQDCGGLAAANPPGTTFGGGDRLRGLVLQANDGTLTQVDVKLSLPAGSTITFLVYENTAAAGTYTQIASSTSVANTVGAAWHQSPAMNVDLEAGMFYSVAAYWSAQGQYFAASPGGFDYTGDYGTIVGGMSFNGTPGTTGAWGLASLAYALRLHTTNEVDLDGDNALACVDCNEGDATIYPGAPEQCNGVDDDCDGQPDATEADADGDGVFICDGDCDDTDPGINPAQPEICDGADTDCNGSMPADELTDGDNDGAPLCADCADGNAAVFPGATEVCNAVDDNCSGTPDDVSVTVTGGGVGSTITTGAPLSVTAAATDTTPIFDLDVAFDVTHTFTSDLDVFLTSPSGTMVELFTDVGGSGDNFIGTVLDDEATATIISTSAPFTGAFQPEGSLAAFDGESPAGTWTLSITDDAGGDDGTLDGWALVFSGPTGDVDNDGYYACNDCDDTNAAVNPGAVEFCDGLDNNCDGTVPSGELDGDGDGVSICDGDCDDTASNIVPGAVDLCGDGIDQDCVGGDLPCGGNAGDVVLNEVMSDPQAVADSQGEWIELYNPTGSAVVLTGWTIQGTSSSFTIGQLLSIPAGGYVVLAANASAAANGGVSADYDWPPSFSLPDGGPSTLALLAGVTSIDDVDLVTVGGPGIAAGVSLSLDPDLNTAVANDDGVNWNLATSAWSGGDLGTPGAANDNLCDGADSTADYDGDGLCDDTDPDDDGDGDLDATDCDDQDPLVYTGAAEGCDLIDTDCDGSLSVDELDVDGDGLEPCNGDCDDGDAGVLPGAEEICDAIDQDCDGGIIETFGDADIDGIPDCIDDDMDGDGEDNSTDCDDADPHIYTGAPEECDGVDSNCDGLLDTDDADGDGTIWCTDGVLEDCDDSAATIYPGAPSLCDGEDTDCSGDDDAGEDDDGDGAAVCDDCDDHDGTSFPDAPEVCDAIDHDCDGDPFNGEGQTEWFADIDGDGFGDPEAPHPDNPLCAQPDDYVDNDGDCDDADPAVNPLAEELCDGFDSDCDPDTEPEGGETDADGDGWLTCAEEAGDKVDCDDGDAAAHPEAVELCDTEGDEDCDGSEAIIEEDPECWEPGCGSSVASGARRVPSVLALLLLAGLTLRRRRRLRLPVAVQVLGLCLLLPATSLAGVDEAKRQMEFAAEELANKRYDRALQSAESALRLCPECLDVMVLKAAAYLGLGERKLAREVMLAYVEEVGESGLSLEAQELYEKLVRRRERPGAAGAGAGARDLSDQDPDVYRTRVAEALEAERCRAARSAAGELVSMLPDDPTAWTLAGDAARCSSAVREAVLAYRKHVSLGGSDARVVQLLDAMAKQLGTVMVMVSKPEGVSSLTLLLDTGEEFIEGKQVRSGYLFVDIAPAHPLVLDVVGTGVKAEEIKVLPLRSGEKRQLSVAPVVVGFGTVSVLPYKLDQIQASISGPEGVVAARPGATMELTVGSYTARVESENGMVAVPLEITRGGLQTFDANEHEPSAITVVGLPAGASVRVFVEGLGGAVAEQQFRVAVANAVLDELTGVLVAPPQKVRNLRPGRGGLFVEHPSLGEGSAEFVLTSGGTQSTEFDWKALPGVGNVSKAFAAWQEQAATSKKGSGRTAALGAATGGLAAASVVMFVVGGVTGSRMGDLKSDAIAASDSGDAQALRDAADAYWGQTDVRTAMFVAGSISAGLGVLGGTLTIVTGTGKKKPKVPGWNPAAL